MNQGTWEMFSMNLRQINIWALLLVLFFLPNNSYAEQKFLTLPFENEHMLMQGWNYNFSNKTHQGIDYYSEVGSNLVATADGTVSIYFQPGSNFVYGKHIVIDHGNGYKTLCAHLSEINSNITNGTFVKRGGVIGKTGMTGTDNPHLHFESLATVPNSRGLNKGHGWRMDPYDLYSTANVYPVNSGYKGMGIENIWLNNYPTVYKEPKASILSVLSGGLNKIDLSWTKAEDVRFDKYEIYRSLEQSGTLDPLKRVLVYSSSDPNILIVSDTSGLSPGVTYYYRIFTYFKSGQIAESNEVNIGIARQYTNITNHPESQQYPTIDGNLITWQDNRVLNPGDYQKLYYFDISTGKVETIGINIEGLRSNAQDPFIKGNYVVYSAQDRYFNSTGTNLYAVSLDAKSAFPISQARGEQQTSVVSDDGIAVWSDSRSGNLDLYYLNLNNAEGEKIFVNAAKNQRSPRIWGNKVVWKDDRVNTKFDLYLKEIGGSEETVLSTTVGDGSPDIWENWVTWVYNGKVSLIDINTKAIKVLADKNAGSNVRVRDGKVVYSINENGTYFIHIYDITSGKDTKLDTPITNMPSVAISGNIIVFDKLEPTGISNTDIYYTVL